MVTRRLGKLLLPLLATFLFATMSLSIVSAQSFSGHRMVLGVAEIITDPNSGEAGRTVWLRKDLGNGQLDHDFVYNDPRRAELNGGYGGITFGVKTGFQSSDVNLTNQIGWMYESIYIWDRETCSNLTLRENNVNDTSPGLVANFFATGAIDVSLVEADLTQVGFLGVSAIFPPGTSTLGVTYTLFWEDENGNLTDIDGNGKIDAALREIYYNDQYNWADNGVEGTIAGVRYFDFPAVAIHEVGHGFSSDHFGNIGRKNGVLVSSPRAVMNAIYGGLIRDLTGRDRGAHCSNWAQWPNR